MSSSNDVQTPERFGGEPLYGQLPVDYSQRVRPFTVVLATPQRHGPTGGRDVYVVNACSTGQAWAKALAHYLTCEEAVDCYVVADDSHEGLPASGRPGVGCSDLRPEYRGQERLDDLTGEAAELCDDLDAKIREIGPVSAVPTTPEVAAELAKVIGDFEQRAFPMVYTLAQLQP